MPSPSLHASRQPVPPPFHVCFRIRSELPDIPQAAAPAQQQSEQLVAEAAVEVENPLQQPVAEAAQEQNQADANKQGFVIEDGGT